MIPHSQTPFTFLHFVNMLLQLIFFHWNIVTWLMVASSYLLSLLLQYCDTTVWTEQLASNLCCSVHFGPKHIDFNIIFYSFYPHSFHPCFFIIIHFPFCSSILCSFFFSICFTFMLFGVRGHLQGGVSLSSSVTSSSARRARQLPQLPPKSSTVEQGTIYAVYE